MYSLTNLPDRTWSGGASGCLFFEDSAGGQIFYYPCFGSEEKCSPVFLSPLQPPTWAATVVRSRTCWIKASRSARSASSSRLTIDSSSCAAFGTRASGFTPLTRVRSQPRPLIYNKAFMKAVELELFKTFIFEKYTTVRFPYPCPLAINWIYCKFNLS